MVTVQKYKRFDLADFRRDLHEIQFDEIRSVSSDPNEMWTVWKNLFLEVLNKHASLDNMKIKGNNLPYITSEIRQLARQRDFLRKKANKTSSRYLIKSGKLDQSIIPGELMKIKVIIGTTREL